MHTSKVNLARWIINNDLNRSFSWYLVHILTSHDLFSVSFNGPQNTVLRSHTKQGSEIVFVAHKKHHLLQRVNLRSTTELANNKLGTQVLHAGVPWVRKVSSVDTLAVGSIANAIAVSADIKGSRDPTRGNTVGARVL